MRHDRDRRGVMWYLRRPRRRVEADIDEELRLHLDLRMAELQAQGLPPDDARREALRRFGDLEGTRRYCREQDVEKESRMHRTLVVDDVVQDVRISLRSLTRAPLLVLTILATVGLGIGATTAVFSAVHAALLKPLPYHEPSRLVRIFQDAPPFKFRLSVADYLALDEQQTHFSGVAAFTERTFSFGTGESADVVGGRAVTSTYFGVLGLRPAFGRDFTETDGRPGSPRTVIASHGFWQQRLGGRPNVVGSTIRLDGLDHELIGILPARVGPLERRQEFFVALQLEPPPRRGPFLYTAVARLRADANPAAAVAELQAINQRIFPIWKSSYQDDRATWALEDLRTAIVGDLTSIAGVALGAVALVWLIACANASSLLVARVTSRQRELAVRAALGASRGRVIRYLLVESALLALGSVALGLAMAWAAMELLRTIGANYFPRMSEVAFDTPVVWLLVALTLASTALFGLVPALHGSASGADRSLRTEGRTMTSSRGARTLRRTLVGAQFAIATPLLIVAALLLASLNELQRVELGFDTSGVVSGAVRLPGAQYREPPRIEALWDEAARRIAALPGVDGVAFADGRAPDDVGNINNFDLEDHPTPAGQSQPATPWVAVTPEYFRVMGLSLLEGRLLERADAEREGLGEVVVDRAWARRFFPGQSAVGKRFREGGCTDCPWTTVVGVVSDVKYAGVDQPNEGAVYWPLQGSLTRYVVVRAQGEPAGVLPSVRQAIQSLEPAAPLTDVATFDELVARSLERPQSLSTLVAVFAGIALLLSIVGIYGVMGYFVQQHEREIGIRVALGGTRRDVLQLVVAQGMRVVVAGVVVGVVAAFGVTRFIASLLYGVDPRSLAMFSGVTVLLTGIALLACLLPARRAVRLEPATVLRNE